MKEEILSHSITVVDNATVDCLNKKLVTGTRFSACFIEGCKLNEGGSCLRPHSQLVVTIEEIKDDE